MLQSTYDLEVSKLHRHHDKIPVCKMWQGARASPNMYFKQSESASQPRASPQGGGGRRGSRPLHFFKTLTSHLWRCMERIDLKWSSLEFCTAAIFHSLAAPQPWLHSHSRPQPWQTVGSQPSAGREYFQ